MHRSRYKAQRRICIAADIKHRGAYAQVISNYYTIYVKELSVFQGSGTCSLWSVMTLYLTRVSFFIPLQPAHSALGRNDHPSPVPGPGCGLHHSLDGQAWCNIWIRMKLIPEFSLWELVTAAVQQVQQWLSSNRRPRNPGVVQFMRLHTYRRWSSARILKTQALLPVKEYTCQ